MEPIDIPKAYDPKEWEDKLYRQWEESGFFNPDTCIEKGVTKADAETFSIVLPPPNVTGHLHAGHAAMLAVEDSVVRYHRMKGDRTLWLPGTDHAAIATQSKVESIIRKEEGKTRHDFTREEFLDRVGQFAQDSHDRITHQVRKMGSSVDWSREAYTLDEKRSFAVRTAFKKLYDDGLIYQGDRIVNWDPELQTTVSDDEIERKEEKSPFYYLQYGPFVISTSRPETKFGDKYVVMHPEDERYAEYFHGQQISLEWIGGSITATIIKDPSVDPAFGTGVMTITPWHDVIDFEIAERHGLEREQIIDFDGKLLPIAGMFAGMRILEARGKIIDLLREKGLVVKIDENYVHNIATNSRGGGLIEPQIKKQWFIAVNKEFERDGRMVTLKQLMRESVSSGRVNILPERFEKVYFHWIDNLRDWCISRQIWFGHRIPVWYRERSKVKSEKSEVAEGEGGTEIYCGVEAPEGDGWEQDPDTLDTWFSSGLWTFSTLGWPDENAKDFRDYHPMNLLETGYDIIFFWVARMILMSEYFLDIQPFDTVYLHGLVRDGQGRKMSKSLGNTIDPLDVSEVHGADAMRLSLLSGTTPGNDIRLSDEKIVSMRNFTNKLWNLARYVGTMSETVDHSEPEVKSDADKDLMKKLHTIVASVTGHIERYELSMAVDELRDFTWGDFADWYVETHKVEKNDAMLRYAFDIIVRLWHPFMPFVTEAIHQTLRLDQSELLMVAKWPAAETTRESIANENRFELIKDLIVKIRNIRAVYKIDPKQKLVITAYGGSEKALRDKVTDGFGAIRDNEEVFKKLARISEVRHTDSRIPPKGTVRVQSGPLYAFLHLEGVIDINAERARLGKELADAEAYAKSLEAKLGNPSFADRAPEAIVTQTKNLLDETNAKAEELRGHLSSIS